MNLKPGCGCITLLLAAANLFLFVCVIYGLATGRMTPIISVISGGVFLGSFVVCVSVGWVSIKQRRQASLLDTGADAKEEQIPISG